MVLFIRFIVCLFCIAAPSTLYAQSVSGGTLLQGGPWVPGRSPMYVGQGSAQAVVMDSGPAGGGGVGVGLAEQLLIARGTGTPPYISQGSGPFGTNWCDYDAPTNNPTGYHFLCFGPNVNGKAYIAVGSGGTATPGAFAFNINGIETIYTGSLPTVYSVGASFTGGLISVANSPITTSGTLAFSVTGNSGGIPYFSTSNTWASTPTLTAGLPLVGGGSGVAPSVATKSGNTTTFVTTTGSLTNGDCVSIDGSGNFVPAGGPCTTGGGGGTVTSSTINNLAYYASTGTTVSGLPTGNNGVLVTNGSGIPSISSTLPSLVQTNITSLGTISAGIWNGTSVGAIYGGTGLSSFTSGGLLYSPTTTTIASSPALTANLPLIGGGAGSAPTVGSRSGNTTTFATTTGSLVDNNCISADIDGNLRDSGTPCSSSGFGVPLGVGLSLTNNSGTPDSKADISLSIANLVSSTGDSVLRSSLSFTVDALVSGANGLDTGSVAANTWYYIWGIDNGSTTAGLISLSSTSPTLPAGYTYKIYLGAMRTDGSIHFYRTLQTGNKSQYKLASGVSYRTMASGTSNVTIATYMPPTSSSIKFSISCGSNDSAYIFADSANTTSTLAQVTGNDSDGSRGLIETLVVAPQLRFNIAAGSCSLLAVGWTDKTSVF